MLGDSRFTINKHIEFNRATVELLKKLFQDGLVGKEVGYKRLPPNLTAKKAYKYIEKITIEPFVDRVL